MEQFKEEIKSWASATTVIKFVIGVVAFSYIIGVQMTAIDANLELVKKSIIAQETTIKLTEKRLRCLEDWKLERETSIKITKK